VRQQRAGLASIADLRMEVRREQQIAAWDAEHILSGAIDRLVLFWSGQTIVAADVIDFKTDAFDRGDEVALANKIAH
jgi:hypothetical protein